MLLEFPAELLKKIADFLTTCELASLESVSHKIYTSVSGSLHDRLGPEFDRRLTEAEASRFWYPRTEAIPAGMAHISGLREARSRPELREVKFDDVKLHAKLARFFVNLPHAVRSEQREQALARAMNKPDGLGRSLLDVAIEERQVSEVKGLLAGGANITSYKPKPDSDETDYRYQHYWDFGLSPVVRAFITGKTEVLALLLEAGVNPNMEVDMQLRSASLLSLAIDHHRIDMMKLLLEAGACPDGKPQSSKARTPLQQAAALGDSKPYKEIPALLLEHGADVNKRGNCRDTPLHFACKQGNADLARLLLEADARTDYLNAKRHTPLDAARAHGHGDCVKLLEEYEQAGKSGQSGKAARPRKKARIDRTAANSNRSEASSSSSEAALAPATVGRSIAEHASSPVSGDQPQIQQSRQLAAGAPLLLFGAPQPQGRLPQQIRPPVVTSPQDTFVRNFAHKDCIGDLTPTSRTISKLLYDAENSRMSPRPDGRNPIPQRARGL